MTESSNKRVAKNAVMLTIRMVIVTIVGLFTSRVVVSTLGVSDYGIYGVVGGVVGMIGFLNASMAGATSRFLTYEMGKGNFDKLSKTFSSTLIAHIIIAIIVVTFSETIGLWYLNYHMNIPSDRIYAANWVFQLSIISTVFGITQIPYSAIIMAHERMGIYAYFEIINVILKLLIVYLLVIGDFDKLILYAVLTLAVSIFMILINRLYCIKHFKESRFHWIWDKSILRPIFTFSMLDIYGNMCATMSNQGVNLIINYFFGVICNAAVSVAQMVQGTIMKLTSTVSTAFRPQIIKLYAQNRIAEMQVVMTNSLKFNILAYSIISIPCFFEAHYVLNLWLGQVPTYSVAFLRVIIIVNFLEANVRVNNIAIHATGRIKRLSFINGSLYLTSPLFMWFAFKLGAVSWMSYVIYGIVLFIILISGLRIISKQISNFKILKFAYDSIKLYVIVLICAIFVSFIIQFLQETFLRVVITTLLFFIILSVLSWFTLLDRDNKIVIVNQIRKYKSKLKLKRF